MDNITEISKVMLTESDPVFREKLKAQVDALTERWTLVMRQAKQQHSKLADAQDQTERLSERMELADKWMDDMNREHLALEYTVHSQDELQQLTAEFQVGGWSRYAKINSCYFSVEKLILHSFFFF